MNKLLGFALTLLSAAAIAGTITLTVPDAQLPAVLDALRSAVPTTGAPPVPPPTVPPSGTIACPGFASTVVLDINWANPQRALTGNIGPNDAIVIRFKTPATGTKPYSSVVGAEFGSMPSTRFATISTTPCDFSNPPPLGWSAESNGSTVVIRFTVGPNPTHYYPELQPSTTYYVNVKTAGGPCAICNMYFDLSR